MRMGRAGSHEDAGLTKLTQAGPVGELVTLPRRERALCSASFRYPPKENLTNEEGRVPPENAESPRVRARRACAVSRIAGDGAGAGLSLREYRSEPEVRVV